MTENTIKQAIAYCKRRIDILKSLNSKDEQYRGKYDRKLSIYNTSINRKVGTQRT